MGSIECLAFLNEKIYFNHYGWQHLIYKGDKVRAKNEIIKRLHWLSYVFDILKRIKTLDNEEKRVKENSVACFWTIKYKVGPNLKLRIILRKLNNGPIHFFSVMDD